MSRAAANAAVSVERFFQFSLWGLVTSGYLAVAGSGYLDRPMVVLVGAGLLLRALQIAGVARLKISPALVTALTLLYIGFFPLDYVFLSRAFVNATVHLVFFLAVIKAIAPLAEMTRYAAQLGSITQGQGSYTMEFSHYDIVPGNVQQQIVSKTKLADEEEE